MLPKLNLPISEIARPTSLDELIGLDHIKNTIKYSIEGAKKLSNTPPPFIVQGPAGCSKTTIAKIIGKYNGGQFHETMGYNLKGPSDIETLASICKDGDTIFIEEAHSMCKKSQIPLLTWLEEYKLYSESGPLDVPRVGFVFSTTNADYLIKPLRERCKILQTSFFKLDQIKQILNNASKKIGMNLGEDDNALTLLAQCSRGTPRIAIYHRLDMLRNVMAVDNLPYNNSTVEWMLKNNNIHPWGLESLDISYCETLYNKMLNSDNRPVSMKNMAQSLGVDSGMIDLAEQYLLQIDAIRIESRGRTLTAFGAALIGKNPLNTNPLSILKRINKIDIVRLQELVKDENVRKGGMKKLSELLGLKYGPDNDIMRTALAKIGCSVRQHVGIVMNE